MARNDFGWTPLHRAAECDFCQSDDIRALLTAGADAKAKDGFGETPWDYAQENEKLKDPLNQLRKDGDI